MSPQLLAKSTRKISTDFLKQNGLEIVSDWFHSPHGVDFFLWRNGRGDVIRFQLSVMGQITEWSLGSDLQTGIICEEEVATGGPLAYEASEKVSYDENPQTTVLVYAYQILTGISGLNEDLLKSLVEILYRGGLSPADAPKKSLLDLLKSLIWLK